jgi:hypothetical protein
MFFAGRPLASREKGTLIKRALTIPRTPSEAAKAKGDAHASGARGARCCARYSIETWQRAKAPGSVDKAPRGPTRRGGSGGRSFQVNSSERFREGGVYSSLSGRHARRSLQAERTRTHTFAANAPHELLTKLSETRHAEGRLALRGRASDAPARAGLPTNRFAPPARSPHTASAGRAHTYQQETGSHRCLKK